MLWSHPLVLWLIPIAPAVAAFGWRAAPRWSVATLRAAAVALLVLAAAGPVWLSRSDDRVHVAVIDASPTTSDQAVMTAARAAAAAGARVIAFSNRAQAMGDPAELTDPARLAATRRRLAEPLWPGDPIDGGAALADALRLAGGLVPPGVPADVMLSTNGLTTRGDAAAEGLRLADRDIPLVVTTDPVRPVAPLPDALVRSLDLPASGSVGQVVAAQVTIESASAQAVHVTLLAEGDAPMGGDVQLRPGLTRITYPVPLRRTGVLTLGATLPGGDPVAAAVVVGAAPTVLVVSDSAHPDGTAAALRATLGSAAVVRQADPAALDAPAALEGVAVVALANLPAAQLSVATQQRLRDAVVRDGTGLLVTGADRSFGAGGYADAVPLAAMLPVRLPRPAQQLDPSVALVLVIDTSGSMFGNRIDLAKEVARLAVGRLTPRDQVGIVEFFGNRRWASPLQTVGDKLEVTRALDRLSAGGGTVLYPAVEEAAFALRNTSARSRHVLILSDGDVENTPFETLVRRMAKDGITVSCGRCGNAADDGDFLSNIAHWGHGRYYEVADPFSLPDVTFKRPRTLPMSPVVDLAAPVRSGPDPLARPFAAAVWPAVGHYARTPAKPTADVLLATDGGDPLLARWRYGAGWVVAMPMDLGAAAAAPLEAAPAFGPMLRALLDDVAGSADRLHVRPVVRPAGLDVAVDALPTTATAAAGAAVRVELVDGGDAVVRTASSPPVFVGHWDVLFPGIAPGTYRVRAAVDAASGVAAVAVPAPRALSRLTPDADLIGAIADPVGVVAGRMSEPPERPVELWIPLALAALACFLAHVATRRWPARSARRSRAPLPARGAAVPAMAAVALACIVPSVRGATSTTRPIGERIRADLLASGSVAGLADQLARQPQDDRTIADGAAVAHEQGDLRAELDLLGRLAAARPEDVDVAERLAQAHEFAGDDAAAERDWRRALALRPSAGDGLRLAALLLDDGQVRPGLAALSQAAQTARPPSLAAGVVAILYGQDAAAVDLLPADDRTAEVLRGEADLRLGRSAEAAVAFAHAHAVATQLSDQRYLAERQLAAARRAGTLDALTDRWLAEGDRLPIACLGPLAGVLRDQGRAGPLLDWWSALAASPDPARRDFALARGVVAEVVGAAVDAGHGDRAEVVAQRVLERDPDSLAALNSAVRVALDLNDAATADGLLDARAARADAADLRRLGDLAASLGREAVAGRCADRLVALGGADAVSGLLLRAGLLAGHGDEAGNAAILDRAAAAVTGPTQALSVADALDVAGRRPAAIAVLQRFAPFADVDLLGQLGWLLEKAGRLPEAAAVYQRVWAGADTDAVRDQAEQHLLALAARTGDLPRVRDAAAARLSAGTGTRADLSLVVDADVRSKDPAPAVAAITASALAGPPVDRLGWAADVWLRTDHLDEAAAALDRLRDAQANDPAARRLTLQRIAELDLRRNRPDLARAAVVAAAQGSDGEAAATLLAGVFARSDAPDAAAAQYRRALAAAGPGSDADQWLLWAQAMAKAGHRGAAIARLQSLCGDSAAAAAEGPLGVGVDGLLNLDAPPGALRPVRRLVLLRVAAAPARSLDAHLLADLSEPLRDARLGRRAMGVGLAADPEQRTDRLRTLVDAARAANDADGALDYGRRLLATGDDLPPSLFLDLGQQLLADGRDAEAARALDRATQVTADDTVRRRAAALAERAALPLDAARLLAPLAARSTGDVPLRVELAGQYEAAGQFDRAEHEYRAALDVALDRLPAAAHRGVDAGGAAGAGRSPRRSPALARRADVNPYPPAPLPDDVRLTLIGAIASAVGTDARAAVVDDVVRHAEAVLRRAQPSGPLPPDVRQMAIVVRAAAFEAQQPDPADAYDRRLIAAWPDDADLRSAAVQTRLYFGLYDRAAALVGPAEVPPLLALRAAVASTRPSTAAPSVDWAALVAPQLIVRDRIGEAAEAVSRLPASLDGAASPASSLLVIAADHALGRQSQIDAAATAWAASITAPGPAQRQAAPRLLNLAAVWPAISPDRRRSLNDLLAAAALSPSTEPLLVPQMARVALDTAVADGVVRPDAAALAERVVGPGLTRRTFYFDGLSLLAVLDAVPAEQQGPVAHLALDHARPTERSVWGLQCVAAAARPLPTPVADAVVAAAAAAAPPGAVTVTAGPGHDVTRRPVVVPWTAWFLNADQPALVQRVCDALVPPSAMPVFGPPAPSYRPVDLQDMVAAAAAQALLGHADRADAAAAAAIDRLRHEEPADAVADLAPRPPVEFADPAAAPSSALLRLAAAALSSPARQRLAAVLTLDIPRATVSGGWREAADTVLLDAVGRREDGLALARAAALRNPRDAVAQAALIRRLKADGRTAELADLLRARLYDIGSVNPALLPDLTTALTALGRLGEVRRITFASASDPEAVGLALRQAVADGDAARASQAFGELLVIARGWGGPAGTSVGVSPTTMGMARLALGGLLDFDRTTPLDGRRGHALTCVPAADGGGVDELTRQFDAAPPGGSTSVEAIAQMLATAAAADPAVAGPLVYHLADLRRRGAMTVNHWLLALRLATTPGVRLPPQLERSVWDAALTTTTPVRGALAAAWAAQGDAASADAATRWVAAVRSATGRDIGGWVEPQDRDPSPFAAPAVVPPRPLPTAPPRSTDPVNDLAEADRLLGLITEGQRSVAEPELSGLIAAARLSVDTHPLALLVWARLAADNGDPAEFGRRFGRVLDANLWGDEQPLLDARLALPSAGETSADTAAVTAGAIEQITSRQGRFAGDTDLCRLLCVVGAWAADRGDAAAATRALDAARQSADRLGAGEHELWVADLAGRVDRSDLATEVQLRLLRERRLPVGRVRSVAAALAGGGKPDAARQLLDDVTRYSELPPVRTGGPTTEPVRVNRD